MKLFGCTKDKSKKFPSHVVDVSMSDAHALIFQHT